MDARRIRPLSQPPHPRRNRYIPLLYLFGLRIVDTEGLDRYFFHDLRRTRPVIIIRADRGDGIHCLDALRHAAECGILVIQMRGIRVHDEKLTAGGVRRHRARHGENAAAVLQIVLEAVRGKLTPDAVAGPADAGTLRVAALNHKTGNDAVKNHAVIKALFHERDKVVHRVRCNIGIKLGLDDIAVFHFDGYNRICHITDSFLS